MQTSNIDAFIDHAISNWIMGKPEMALPVTIDNPPPFDGADVPLFDLLNYLPHVSN